MNIAYSAVPNDPALRGWHKGIGSCSSGATSGRSALLGNVALASTWLDALASGGLELHGQSICPLHADKYQGHHWFEVLMRLRGNDGQLLTPREFVPIAERCGLMPEFDRWVVRRALAWLADHNTDPSLSLSLNLSATSIERADMLQFVLEHLDRGDVDPRSVCFEITETAAIHNLDQAVTSISALKRRGCRFALDDFGTGSSSLAYLRHLDVDYLKIDAGFVRGMRDHHSDFVLVRTMANMARDLGIVTIAEGIEDPATVGPLKHIGVLYGQGHALGAVSGLDQLTPQSNPIRLHRCL